MAFQFDLPRQGTSGTSEEIRGNMNSLATTNLTDDSAFPTNPRDGMQRIFTGDPSNIRLQVYYGGSWITLISNISLTTTPSSHKEESFTSSAVWTYDHNLGKRPLVQVLNSADQLIQPATIEHASVDRVVVTHGSAISGSIIVVG